MAELHDVLQLWIPARNGGPVTMRDFAYAVLKLDGFWLGTRSVDELVVWTNNAADVLLADDLAGFDPTRVGENSVVDADVQADLVGVLTLFGSIAWAVWDVARGPVATAALEIRDSLGLETKESFRRGQTRAATRSTAMDLINENPALLGDVSRLRAELGERVKRIADFANTLEEARRGAAGARPTDSLTRDELEVLFFRVLGNDEIADDLASILRRRQA